MSKVGHKIQVIGRINMQYYLIKYCDRHYLLDYSDPSKISNYGPLCLLSGDRELTIYDVEEEKERYLQNLTFNYFSHRFSIFCLFLFLVVLFALGSKINGSNLTDFWYIYELAMPIVVFASFILVTVVVFKISSHKTIDVSSYGSVTLELIDLEDELFSPTFKRIFLIASSYFSLWFSLGVAFYTASVGLSIIFGFLYPFFIIFYRFIVCGLSLPDKDSYRRVYKIK
ncbi:hypothetical protein [Bombilactobacillus thymidiniphilus]|uniref:Tandem five-TM protein n=1 Tax=Bombilactobacillus thymidiniphilus TaxID=2923363 RepID=A0ABY4PBZ2_9LACO|nr:hypothetical protein [Bombilactobacillus thymidiniphilus]UQS83062.1 hypothetical protein MOO47_04560 [Bombilactobacillus thymidiniphilus]